MKTIRSLLAMLLCLASFTVSAQWQWVDKDGKRVFSDRAPGADIPAKDILKQPGGRSGTNGQAAPAVASAQVKDKDPGNLATATAAPPQSAASAPRLSRVDKELEAKKKQEADAETAKRKAEEDRITKAKIENCARAKQSKATFDSGVRIARANAKGENEVMDDAARAQELKRIQSVMASDCI